MSINRIVSFLPSATEILYELESGDRLYGVTHECNYPENAKTKMRVIDSVINSDELTSKEIDKKTCQLFKEGKEIFILNEKNMLEANPDLIISQETCEVCAAYTSQVNRAIQVLQKKPLVYSMNPHDLEGIIESVKEIGIIIEKEKKAIKITDDLKERIHHIKSKTSKIRPKVLAIEWIEPFFTAGHWIPEMINYAGGNNLISQQGEHSRKLSIVEIIESDPDIIVLMPCGFDTFRTISEYNNILKENKLWNTLKAVKNKQIFAVDANSYFSKPSIRTITGLEIENFLDLNLPKNSVLQIK